MSTPSNPYAELPEKLSKLIDERRRYYDVAGDSVEVAMIEAIKAISQLTRDVERQKQIAADAFRDYVNAQARADTLTDAMQEIAEKASGAGYCPEQAVSEIDTMVNATLTRLKSSMPKGWKP